MFKEYKMPVKKKKNISVRDLIKYQSKEAGDIKAALQ